MKITKHGKHYKKYDFIGRCVCGCEITCSEQEILPEKNYAVVKCPECPKNIIVHNKNTPLKEISAISEVESSGDFIKELQDDIFPIIGKEYLIPAWWKQGEPTLCIVEEILWNTGWMTIRAVGGGASHKFNYRQYTE